MDNPKYEYFLLGIADKVAELVALRENRKCFEQHSCDIGKKHVAYLKAWKHEAKQMPLDPLSRVMDVLDYDKDNHGELPRPKIDEALAYYYFSLATIHDKMRNEEYTPIHNDRSAKQLAKSVWPIIENLCVDRQFIIKAAFKYVKADLAIKQKKNEAKKEPAETEEDNPPDKEEKADVNIHISGGIQAENVQIGNNASIQKPQKKEKSKGRSKTIFAFVSFFAALLTCIYLSWWLWTKFWPK